MGVALLLWFVTGFVGNLIVCRRLDIHGADLGLLSALSLLIGPFVLFSLGED